MDVIVHLVADNTKSIITCFAKFYTIFKPKCYIDPFYHTLHKNMFKQQM